jgi:hypothetical protein
MSKLNFASINEAFILGSDQIKNTQEEIAKLKALVIDSNGLVSPPKSVTPEYKRTEQQPLAQSPNTQNPQSGNDFDYNFLKLMQHPKFDDIVKNYVLLKYPEIKFPINTESPISSISHFGNKYSRTVCSDVKNYIIFFIISLIVYLFLSLYLTSTKS